MKLICGFLGRPDRLEMARWALIGEFGAVDFESAPRPFDRTDYYEKEMGSGLSRVWISFRRLVHPEELANAKAVTNRLEMRFSGPGGKRTVNLDPGLLDESKLILASTKNHAHRIYLSHGIYAEVTMVYRDGAWRDLPWTYPDYRDNRHVFDEIRGILRGQRRET
jgi:hypothetical protein